MSKILNFVEHMLASGTVKSTEAELMELLDPAHLAFVKYTMEHASTDPLMKKGEGLITKYTALLNELKAYAHEIAPQIEEIASEVQTDAKTIENQTSNSTQRVPINPTAP